MALPIIPIVLAISAVTSAVAIARKIHIGPVNLDVEDALDTVDEGVYVRKMPNNRQVNASGRWKRVIRFGTGGPGLEIDASGLGRLRVKAVRS